MLVPAVLIGWSVTAVQAGLLAVGPWGSWNSENFPIGDGQVRAEGIALLLGNHWQNYSSFALNWTLTLLVGSVVSVIPALGEELGWRAVLQPELERRMGQATATITVGLIWGYWHLPINLSGFNDSVHPMVTAVLLFPLGSIFLSFPFAWLFRRSRSVWPPALCHGAGDAILGGLLLKPNSWVVDNISLMLATALIAIPFIILVIRPPVSGLPRQAD
jgi:membrane protease YdiL (CAAX protease family)